MKKKKSNIIYIIIMIIAACVFIVAAVKLISVAVSYNTAKDYYEDVRSLFEPEVETGDQSEEDETLPALDEDGLAMKSFNWDYSKLLEINQEALGYIRFRGDAPKVDYPIVDGRDNSYYLTHMFDGTENSSGAIFVDANIVGGLDADYCIIHGHNMRSGSGMFKTLANFDDPAYAQEHSEADVYIGEKHYVYKVFAMFVADINGDIFYYGYDDNLELMELIEGALERSVNDMGIELSYFSEDSHVITLSTCLTDYRSDKRYVVLLVRDRELE